MNPSTLQPVTHPAPRRRLESSVRLPAIVAFWESAYAKYRRPLVQGAGFHVPAFPFPLLSPNFVSGSRKEFLEKNRGLLSHFNEIVPLGHGQREFGPEGFKLSHQFFLGERKLSAQEIPENTSARVIPMRAALQQNLLLSLIQDGFPKDAPFLSVLLPFLCTLEAEFHTALLEEGEETIGVISVGVAGGAALVLNAVVAAAHRGRGVSPVLTKLAQNTALTLGAERAFFWTDHAFLGRHADVLQHYRIYTKI